MHKNNDEQVTRYFETTAMKTNSFRDWIGYIAALITIFVFLTSISSIQQAKILSYMSSTSAEQIQPFRDAIFNNFSVAIGGLTIILLVASAFVFFDYEYISLKKSSNEAQLSSLEKKKERYKEPEPILEVLEFLYKTNLLLNLDIITWFMTFSLPRLFFVGPVMMSLVYVLSQFFAIGLMFIGAIMLLWGFGILSILGGILNILGFSNQALIYIGILLELYSRGIQDGDRRKIQAKIQELLQAKNIIKEIATSAIHIILGAYLIGLAISVG